MATSNQKQVNAIVKAVSGSKGKSTAEQAAAITKAYQSTGGASATGSSKISKQQYQSVQNDNTASYSKINQFLANPSDWLKQNAAIDASKLTAPQVTLPEKPQIPNYQSTIEANNFALGVATPTPVNQPVTAEPMSTQDLLLSKYYPEAPQSISEDKGYLAREKEVQRQQREFNNYNAQLNAIVAKSQADQLRVTGQGRGIPEVIIGGQQAQIAKEAAIQALPIQAQLAAAQGNLAMAKESLDQYYKIRSQDIMNTYSYKQDLFKTVLGIANQKEQNQIEEKRIQAQFQHDKDMAALNYDYDRKLKQIGLGDTTITENSPLYAGLNGATSTAVRGQVSAFKTEPTVQNFTQIQEGYNFVRNLKDTTTNPADDQALIYSLAKTLDPGSVVREGEYATAQKYAQSWVKAYGKGVTQAIAGTGFLSEEARKNIKATIASKYNSSLTSYRNIENQYINSINSLTGRNNGKEFLKDYAMGELAPENQPSNITPQDNDIFNSIVKPTTGYNPNINYSKTNFWNPAPQTTGFNYQIPTFNLTSFFK